MKQSIFSCGILLIIAALIGYSCKKGVNNNPFGTTKLATAVVNNNGSIENYQFFYDGANNLDSVSITGGGAAAGHNGFLKYTYIGSSWRITDQNGNSFMVYANTAGQLLKVLITDTITFIYSNNQLTKENIYSTTFTSPFYVNTATFYTWQNGDVTKSVTGSQTKSYTYNSGKNGQPGDPIRIVWFLAYGASPLKTVHLPVSLTNSSTQGINYSYALDNKGRINTFTQDAYNKTLNTHDTTTYSYTYY